MGGMGSGSVDPGPNDSVGDPVNPADSTLKSMGYNVDVGGGASGADSGATGSDRTVAVSTSTKFLLALLGLFVVLAVVLYLTGSPGAPAS